jgi:hypothetical protein
MTAGSGSVKAGGGDRFAGVMSGVRETVFGGVLKSSTSAGWLTTGASCILVERLVFPHFAASFWQHSTGTSAQACTARSVRGCRERRWGADTYWLRLRGTHAV